jgi:Peptidase S24-like
MVDIGCAVCSDFTRIVEHIARFWSRKADKMSVYPSKMLRLIRACTGLGTEQFAAPLDRKRGAVESAEKGRVEDSTIHRLIQRSLAHYAKEIPEFLSREAKALLPEESPMPTSSETSSSRSSDFRELRVITLNRLGHEEAKGTFFSDCRDDKAFAIVVGDTSLETEVRRGSIAVLDPGASLHEGSLVGAYLKIGGIVVRRYSVVSGARSKMVLTSKDPDQYPPLKLDSKTGVRWIYPVYSFTARQDTV